MTKARLGISLGREEMLLLALRPGSGDAPAKARLPMDWSRLGDEGEATALAAELAGVVGRLDVQVGGGLEETVVSLAGGQVLCHRLSPARGRRAGQDELQDELEEASPFEPDELYSDYQLLPGGDGAWEAATVRREVADQAAELMEAAGLSVAGLDGEARYLAAGLPRLLPSKQPSVYFHVTPDQALVVRADGGEPLDWRLVRALAGEEPEALARRAEQGVLPDAAARGESRAVFLGPAAAQGAAGAQGEDWGEVVVASQEEMLPGGLGWEWLALFAHLDQRRLPSWPGNLLPGERASSWLERPSLTAALAVMILLVLTAWGGMAAWRETAREQAMAGRIHALKKEMQAARDEREELLAARRPVEMALERNQAALAALSRAGGLSLPAGAWLQELSYGPQGLTAQVASLQPLDLESAPGMSFSGKPKLVSAKDASPVVWEVVLQPGEGKPAKGGASRAGKPRPGRSGSLGQRSARSTSPKATASRGLPTPGGSLSREGEGKPAAADRGEARASTDASAGEPPPEPPPVPRKARPAKPAPARRTAQSSQADAPPPGLPPDLPPPPSRTAPAPSSLPNPQGSPVPPGITQTTPPPD